MRYKAVIFDLDGTLLNTLDDIADTVNEVLTSENIKPFKTEEYKYFVGEGLKSLFQKVTQDRCSDSQISTYCELFNQSYSKNWNRKTCLYPDIGDMLDRLIELGLKIGVLSNKPHYFTKKYVDYFFEDYKVAPCFGQREGVPKKPDPAGLLEIAQLLQIETSQIIYVGDSSIDMLTGKAAGALTVGVSWGFRTTEELTAHGADVIIDKPLELIKYARSNS